MGPTPRQLSQAPPRNQASGRHSRTSLMRHFGWRRLIRSWLPTGKNYLWRKYSNHGKQYFYLFTQLWLDRDKWYAGCRLVFPRTGRRSFQECAIRVDAVVGTPSERLYFHSGWIGVWGSKVITEGYEYHYNGGRRALTPLDNCRHQKLAFSSCMHGGPRGTFCVGWATCEVITHHGNARLHPY